MPARFAARLRRLRLATAAVAVAWLAALAVAIAMPRGLFSGDEGVKLAPIQQLAASGYRDASLYDRGVHLVEDPQLNLFSNMPAFARQGPQGGKRYGTYPLLYAALAVPLYWLGGPFAVAGLSLLGVLVALLATAQLARRCLGSEKAAAAVVAIVGLTSPMLHYGCLLYEHTVAAAALLAAIAMVTARAAQPASLAGADQGAGQGARQGTGLRRWVLAGALYGLATCFRTELYSFAPAMALILGWRLGVRRAGWTRWLAFGLGAALVIGAFLVAHRLATPFWHPTLAVSQGAPPSLLRDRLLQLVPPPLLRVGKLAVIATLLAGGLVQLLGPARRTAVALVTVAVAAGWASLAGSMIAAAQAGHLRTLTGLLTTTPLVALALLRPARRGRSADPHPGAAASDLPAAVVAEAAADRASPVAALTAAAVLFIAIVVLLPKRGSGGGLELGSRYLLPMVPLLAIAAVEHARRHWLQRVSAGVLIALGLWGAAVNLRAEARIRGLGAHILTAIQQARAEVMLTQVWWVGQIAVPSQDHTSLFIGRQPTAIYDRLFDAGIVRVVALRGPPPPAAGRVQLRALGTTAVVDPEITPQIYELVDPAPPQ